jgi:hypothetical protein
MICSWNPLAFGCHTNIGVAPGNMLLLRPDFWDVVSVAQLVEPWIVAPVVAGSIPVAHPNHRGNKRRQYSGVYCKICIAQYAPVAQLDRASDFESAGRPFESGRVHH